MLKYLIVQLCDNAVSFCQYESTSKKRDWIPFDVLARGIHWAQKQNLSIQFVYPEELVPEMLQSLIDSVDYSSIVPVSSKDCKLVLSADVVVANAWCEVDILSPQPGQSCIIRTTFEQLLTNQTRLTRLMQSATRINIVVTNIQSFTDSQIVNYQLFLDSLIPSIVEEYKQGHQIQFNLITDRLMLDGMNNCNAGYETVTLCPDGKFYICPAYYMKRGGCIGDIDLGLDIKNGQLYKLSHAPICRICDAYHCKRCIWLNLTLCGEVNTPSHQQCLMSHIERNASQKLLAAFRKIDATFMSDITIPSLDYLDPIKNIIK